MALGLMRALNERGLRVPQDISIIGFDDHEFASQFDPPLTTVRQDFVALGRLCVSSLQDSEPDARHTISPDLIIRKSTEPPPPAREFRDNNRQSNS